MKFMHWMAAAVVAVAGTAATTASATTVQLVPGSEAVVELAPGSPVGQNFVSQLQNAGATHLYSGSDTFALNLAADANVTFTLVAAESGFDNSLLLNGAQIISENVINQAVANFATGILNGQSFSTILTAGTNLASILSFDIDSDGTADFGGTDDEFGVFASTPDIDALSVFYLALDDSGASADDNHDDIIIRVDIAPVPLPAAAWMLLAGVGGLVGMRRLRKTA